MEKPLLLFLKKKVRTILEKLKLLPCIVLPKKKNCIVACGGGTACFNDNIHWMNKTGTTVYLSATAQYIFNRVFEEKDKRPLISKLNQAELLFFVEQKLKERESFYNKAKLILSAENLNIASLKEHLNL